MYYATCRQRVCGQNKDNLCLHAARTLIWRSCAFNRGPMTMPVLDGPMTMPVLDGPMTMHILDGPMTMHVLDGPMTMPVLDGPMTMHVLDGPMTMPVLDGPMTIPVLDGPMTMPVLDGPMTMHVLDGPTTMHVLDGVKPMAITLPICRTSESLFWKRKKKHILLNSVETNLNIWRVRWPSPRQVRVQIPTSPRQVRDDRKTSRDRTRVLQPYIFLPRPIHFVNIQFIM